MAATIINQQCGHIAVGTITGTGALITESLGFSPKFVEIYNATKNTRAVMVATMIAGTGQKVVDSGTGTTDLSMMATTGITLTSNGFTIGTDANINANADVIHYLAIG